MRRAAEYTVSACIGVCVRERKSTLCTPKFSCCSDFRLLMHVIVARLLPSRRTYVLMVIIIIIVIRIPSMAKRVGGWCVVCVFMHTSTVGRDKTENIKVNDKTSPTTLPSIRPIQLNYY